MSLKSKIEKLRPGESFVTEHNRTGIYVAAKRADVEISTEVVDSGIKVTRKTTYQKMVEVISVVDQIAALPPKDRLELFERFELCCGMNRGECVCPPEQLYDQLESDTWIEDPQTYENGEILYWHHKPKCKPVCYRRESDTSAA